MPANEIIGLPPGEVFVHRNIANVVVHSDLNCLSVIQFAVDILRVKHIMVVGHYGCSGVNAALLNRRVGLADNWLHHVQDVRERHGAARRMAGGRSALSPPDRAERDRAGRQRAARRSSTTRGRAASRLTARARVRRA